MIVGMHDADGGRYPNLALMKLAAWHRQRGDKVFNFLPLENYDRVYSSRVFSWKKSDPYLPKDAICGGTGYGRRSELPEEIEHICPDYSLYGLDYSLGFLTRGCSRQCPWCVVPQKEGVIRAHADITEFCRHKNVVLMDNNILALPEYAAAQMEKMARMGLKVDFNQGLDARLIDRPMARLLAGLKWLKPIRLACDTTAQMADVERAVRLLREAGATPRTYFCYVLVKEVPSALERVEFLRELKVDPFAMPYRDLETGAEPAPELKRFARWVNRKWLFKSVPWCEYQPAWR